MPFDMGNEFNPYSSVDNILIPHPPFEKVLNRLNQCFKAMESATDPVCLAIVGESRTGKSRALEQFELEHRTQRLADGLFVPFARIRVPSKPTVKGLAELLLYRVGDPMYHKGTENAKTIRLLKLLKTVRTRMIALDEFQHFYDKTTRRVQHHVADWLKVIVDDAQVALTVAGLPNCMSVILQNEQLMGRFLAPVRLARMNWTTDKDRETFRSILGQMQEGLANYDMPAFDSDEMAFRFYCASGGLIGYLVKILKQAVCNAVDTKVQYISLGSLEIAFHEAVVCDGTLGSMNPFDGSLRIEPDEATLARCAKVGLPQVEEPVSRSKKTVSKPNLREVLSTR